jgi:DNA-binding NarL/FixJ family response regulator
MNPVATPVLLVDDQAAFRSIARTVNSGTPRFLVAGEAASGEEAVRLAAEPVPDGMLIDINVSAMSGSKASCLMVAAAPSTVVALLSTWSDRDLPRQAATLRAAGGGS